MIPDHSRHIPDSAEWWTYWDERLDRLLSGEPCQESIPLEYTDAVITRAGRGAAAP